MASRKLEVVFVGDTKSLEQSFKRVDSVSGGTGAKLQKVGGTLTKTVTPAMVGIGAAAFKAFNDVNAGVKEVTIGTGASGRALDGLHKSFKNVAGNVQQDGAEVGKVMADLNTRTGATGKGLESLTRRTLDMSRMLGEDAAGSVRSVTRVMGDWGVKLGQAPGLLDKLFVASQATGVGVSDLSEQLVRYGAPLRQMGFGIDTATGLLAKFEKEGVNAQLVMGSLRIALGKMAREGIKDPAKALAEITRRIKGAGSAGEANALALEYFGARAGPDMAAAIREGRFEVDDLVKQLKGSEGAIQKTADSTQDASDRMKIAFNRAKVSLAPLGEAIANGLSGAVNAVTPILVKMGDALAAMPAPMRSAIVGAMALAAALGPVLLVVGKVVSAFGPLISVVARVGAVVARNMWVIRGLTALIGGPWLVAIGAAIAIGVALYKNWDKVVAGLSAAWNWAKDAATAAFGAIASVVTGAWDAIRSATSAAWDAIKAVLSAAWDVIKFAVTTYFEAYRAIIVGVWNAIRSATSAAWNAIRSALSAAWGLIRSGASAAWEGIKTAIVTPFNVVKGVVTGVANAIHGALGSAWGTIKSSASAAWGYVRDRISGAIDSAYGAVKSTIGSLIGFVKSGFGKVKDAIVGVGGAIYDAITWPFRRAYDAIRGIVGKIKGVVGSITGLPGKALSAVGLAKGGVFSRSGVQALASGGVVSSPMVVMGEDAPRFDEYVIPTNPAHRSRALDLVERAAAAIGAPRGGGGPLIGELHVHGSAIDAEQLARSLAWQIATR